LLIFNAGSAMSAIFGSLFHQFSNVFHDLFKPNTNPYIFILYNVHKQNAGMKNSDVDMINANIGLVYSSNIITIPNVIKK